MVYRRYLIDAHRYAVYVALMKHFLMEVQMYSSYAVYMDTFLYSHHLQQPGFELQDFNSPLLSGLLFDVKWILSVRMQRCCGRR